MARNKKTTHVRIEKEILQDFKREMPGVTYTDIVRMSWQNYKAINKMGRFIYGNIWKVSKKK